MVADRTTGKKGKKPIKTIHYIVYRIWVAKAGIVAINERRID
jgi:hypothetical protein